MNWLVICLGKSVSPNTISIICLQEKHPEIKSYLYAWLGARHCRPTYDIRQVGERPNIMFRCDVSGIENVADEFHACIADCFAAARREI